MIRRSTAILVFTYPAAILDSKAALIASCKMLASIYIGALMKIRCRANGLVKSGLLPRKWYPPTWLLPPMTDRYKESDDTYKTILDALNMIDRLGYIVI